MSNVCSQEKLESIEMREAIYESHGIMTSADKNIFSNYNENGAEDDKLDDEFVILAGLTPDGETPAIDQ